jgi:hypothetical protein
LLDEFRAIGRLNERSVILIDNARLFLCPPPVPHETSQCPLAWNGSLAACNVRPTAVIPFMLTISTLLAVFPPSAIRVWGEVSSGPRVKKQPMGRYRIDGVKLEQLRRRDSPTWRAEIQD